jgi:dTMP kinase
MSENNSISGKLIVIDGTDGSGKQTQSKLLIERLKSIGHNAVYFDFPQHGQPSAALVDMYLNGEFGKLEGINGAKVASGFYAFDRFCAAPKIRKVLESGGTAICDRYESANKGHQAGKIHDLVERDKFLAWLEHLEFDIFGIPRPDMNILLYVSTAINQQLVDMKNKREYLNGKIRDIHENDLQHLNDAASAFLYCARKYDWSVIYCAPDGVILPVEEIHEMVWKEIEKKFTI